MYAAAARSAETRARASARYTVSLFELSVHCTRIAECVSACAVVLDGAVGVWVAPPVGVLVGVGVNVGPPVTVGVRVGVGVAVGDECGQELPVGTVASLADQDDPPQGGEDSVGVAGRHERAPGPNSCPSQV